MSQDKLLLSISNLFNAIHNRYPELHGNPADIEATGLVIINEVAKNLDQNNDIAFVEKGSDGSMLLNVLKIQINPKNVNKV